MSETTERSPGAAERLAATGYWPARAARALAEGKYSQAVEICRANMESGRTPTSARGIYARALYHAGQTESAREQFYSLLAYDADNLVALKYLGDICFEAGDEPAAIAHYQRVLEIDPDCRGLVLSLERSREPLTRTITLKNHSEHVKLSPQREAPRRDIPFYTETVGDLYLAQGYPRLAVQVFEMLSDRGDSPRLKEKLAKARLSAEQKEH
ncbi:MAG TPA: tetratricopeptide repeat protein [candidate division Zixibacteria bacterium]|nr:tetratricopeptide repeat protein [candidate division Zixibacteria bacterium]